MPETKRSHAMKVELLSLNYHVPACDTHFEKFPVVIGTAPDAEIHLEDYTVSKYHCEIDLIDDKLRVRDLDSHHGTYVNGEEVEESALQNGDELAVGLQTFLVQVYQEAKQDLLLSPKSAYRQQPTMKRQGAAIA
jgi:pSer/pThr/pTyr-binding forkhead associated (FHA) protein